MNLCPVCGDSGEVLAATTSTWPTPKAHWYRAAVMPCPACQIVLTINTRSTQ